MGRLKDFVIDTEERLEGNSFSVGSRLKEIREARGLSQVQFGALVGLSGNRIQQYESGYRTPKEELLHKMADALEVSPLSLEDPTLSSITNAMFVLFALEDSFGMQLEKNGDEFCLRVGKTQGIYPALVEWFCEKESIKEALENTSTDLDRKEVLRQYAFWKWTYPDSLPEDFLERRKTIRMEQIEAILDEMYSSK